MPMKKMIMYIQSITVLIITFGHDEKDSYVVVARRVKTWNHEDYLNSK